MNYEIRGILFFDVLSFQRHVAQDMIEFLLKNSPRKISKYGFSEITKRKLSPDKIELLTNNLSNYPEYFSGDIYLSDGKNLLFHLDYKVGAPFIIRIFGKSKDLSIQVDFLEFMKKMTGHKLLSYGFIASDSVLKFQNFKINKKGSQSTESFEGLSLEHGIPGLYEVNFFSKECFPPNFKASKTKPFKINHGYIFSFENLDEEQLVTLKKSLGKDEFFGSDSSLKSIFYKRFSNKENINNYQIPQYTNRILKKKTPTENLFPFNELEDDSDLKDFQNKIILQFSNLDTEDGYLSLIASAGIVFNKYLLQFLKTKKPKDVDFMIHLIQNEDIYVINPYHVIALLIEDYLDLTEFLSYLKLKFGLK